MFQTMPCATEARPVPTLKQWPLDRWCDHCQQAWSPRDEAQVFIVDATTWERVMNVFYSDWAPGKTHCQLRPNPESMADRVMQSLWSCEVYKWDTEMEGEEFATRLRKHFWKPEIREHTGRMWMYKGEHAGKFICFGCIECQRGITVYYQKPRFQSIFDAFYPQ